MEYSGFLNVFSSIVSYEPLLSMAKPNKIYSVDWGEAIYSK